MVETKLKGWQGDIRWQGVDTPVAQISENKKDVAWALVV